MNNVTFLSLLLFLLTGCASVPSPRETTVFYPPLPQEPRLQYLFSISDENDVSDQDSELTAFLIGDTVSDRRIGKPYDIGSAPGKIYVLDKRVNGLQIIDLAERTFSSLDDRGMGALSDPSGIWVEEDHTSYIADMKRKQVMVFDSAGKFLRTYGDGNVLDKPVDVAVSDNNVYVCDMDKNQVLVFDKQSGNLKKQIGKKGSQDGLFQSPSHLALDRDGQIYVNDAFNNRVQKFDQTGAFIRSFGYLGNTFGALVRPKGLDVDHGGHLYVVDAAFENVQIFDSGSGRLLLFFGESGTLPGNMYLPAALHIDYVNAPYFANYVDENFELDYVVYVGNMFGSRKINVYGFGKWTGSKLPNEPVDTGQP